MKLSPTQTSRISILLVGVCITAIVSGCNERAFPVNAEERLPDLRVLGETGNNVIIPMPDRGWIAQDPVERDLARFDSLERRLSVVASRGLGPGELGALADLARGGGDGEYFLLDNGTRRITHRSADGTIVAEFPVSGNPMRIWPIRDTMIAVYAVGALGPAITLYDRRSGRQLGESWDLSAWRQSYSPAASTVKGQAAHAYSAAGDIVAADAYTGEMRCATMASTWPPQAVEDPRCSWTPPEQPHFSPFQLKTLTTQMGLLLQAAQKLLPGNMNNAFAGIAERWEKELAAVPAQPMLHQSLSFSPDGSLWVATPWLEDADALRSAVYRVARDGTASQVAVVDGWATRLVMGDAHVLVMATQPDATSLGWRVSTDVGAKLRLRAP